MKLLDSVVTQAAGIAALRRDIHAHPELCFQEIRTADLVAAKLTEWGITGARGDKAQVSLTLVSDGVVAAFT